MFDTRAVPPAPGNKNTIRTEGVLVDTNVVLQRALRQLSSEERGRIVLRCDELPSAAGSEDDLEAVFSALLQMILQKKESVSKLFLHIHCTTGENNEKATGQEPFSIQFYTNITPCVAWLQTHERQMTEMAALLHRYGGSLTVKQRNNKGCVFSVSLRGKPL